MFKAKALLNSRDCHLIRLWRAPSTQLGFGRYGTKSCRAGRLSYRAIEAARRAIIRHFHRAMSGQFRRNDKIWLRVLVPINEKKGELRSSQEEHNAPAKGSTGQVLLQLLEMCLDNILFRLGMASTIPAARQLVNHRHILVNGRIVDIPSYRCKPRDIIMAKDEQKSRALIQKSLDSSPRHHRRLGTVGKFVGYMYRRGRTTDGGRLIINRRETKHPSELSSILEIPDNQPSVDVVTDEKCLTEENLRSRTEVGCIGDVCLGSGHHRLILSHLLHRPGHRRLSLSHPLALEPWRQPGQYCGYVIQAYTPIVFGRTIRLLDHSTSNSSGHMKYFCWDPQLNIEARDTSVARANFSHKKFYVKLHVYREGHEKKGEFIDERSNEFWINSASLRNRRTIGVSVPTDHELMLKINEGLKKGHAYGFGATESTHLRT
ncbi:hypothetical protein M9H77_21478 [Catharanthus roseus]|uniref:Uncharacterized protein n=1 Tax=Catharanthus roseus TaxID=4058 RepID=A0ACC0AMP5_CATRO|nr:hypothetical protein M9H77_21478 [Catharanthus roseus]